MPGCAIARAVLAQQLETVGQAAQRGRLPGGAIENGRLRVDRLEKSVPDGAEELVLKLYGEMPLARITDVLLDVDNRIGFIEVFTDLRTGTRAATALASCRCSWPTASISA